MNSFYKIVFSITLLTVLYSAPVFCMDIFEAAITGDTAIVRELLDPVAVPEAVRIALVNQQNLNGWTPLHCAAFRGHADITRILLGAVPESSRPDLINQQDNNGQAILHWAVGMGHTGTARIIIDAVPEAAIPTLVNQKDHDGQTPLFYAAMFSHTEIALMLIANGANLGDKDNKDKTPAQAARANNHPEIANLIDDAQQRIANASLQTKIIAETMAQAYHAHLGDGSPVAQFMPQDLLREVMTLVGQANKQEARQPEPEQAPRWCVVS